MSHFCRTQLNKCCSTMKLMRSSEKVDLCTFKYVYPYHMHYRVNQCHTSAGLGSKFLAGSTQVQRRVSKFKHYSTPPPHPHPHTTSHGPSTKPSSFKGFGKFPAKVSTPYLRHTRLRNNCRPFVLPIIHWCRVHKRSVFERRK